VLGTLNGLAQTLSAAGRAAGPFPLRRPLLISNESPPKGEALAWGTFGGIAFLGWIVSFGIRGEGLESAEWDEENGSLDDDDDDDEEDGGVGR
jgi:hypothetical protein